MLFFSGMSMLFMMLFTSYVYTQSASPCDCLKNTFSWKYVIVVLDMFFRNLIPSGRKLGAAGPTAARRARRRPRRQPGQEADHLSIEFPGCYRSACA